MNLLPTTGSGLLHRWRRWGGGYWDELPEGFEHFKGVKGSLSFNDNYVFVRGDKVTILGSLNYKQKSIKEDKMEGHNSVAMIREEKKVDEVAAMVRSLFKSLERAENFVAELKGEPTEVRKEVPEQKQSKHFEQVWGELSGDLAEINGRLNDLLQRLRLLILGFRLRRRNDFRSR